MKPEPHPIVELARLMEWHEMDRDGALWFARTGPMPSASAGTAALR
jgi:hypothetical protein